MGCSIGKVDNHCSNENYIKLLMGGGSKEKNILLTCPRQSPKRKQLFFVLPAHLCLRRKKRHCQTQEFFNFHYRFNSMHTVACGSLEYDFFSKKPAVSYVSPVPIIQTSAFQTHAQSLKFCINPS